MPELAMKADPTKPRRKRRGSSVLELTLLSPWVFFLFIGVVDVGFYSYALISVENAARIAAEYTSQTATTAADQSGACTKVLAELSNLSNVASLTTCGAAPLTVTATSVAGPDGGAATSVSVTYQTISLIPIPGFLQSQLTVTRNVKMRIKG